MAVAVAAPGAPVAEMTASIDHSISQVWPSCLLQMHQFKQSIPSQLCSDRSPVQQIKSKFKKQNQIKSIDFQTCSNSKRIPLPSNFLITLLTVVAESEQCNK
jgi:hypothetical protein